MFFRYNRFIIEIFFRIIEIRLNHSDFHPGFSFKKILYFIYPERSVTEHNCDYGDRDCGWSKYRLSFLPHIVDKVEDRYVCKKH